MVSRSLRYYSFCYLYVFCWLTCTMLATVNGLRASMVTTHGEMLVPKFLARNGPNGTYSHFCMSRAVEKTYLYYWMIVPLDLKCRACDSWPSWHSTFKGINSVRIPQNTILVMRGPSLYVTIWRLPDVCRRQILASKDDPRAERIKPFIMPVDP